MFCFIHHRPCRKIVAESGKYKGELVYKCIIKNCRFVRPVAASVKTVKQRRNSEPTKSKRIPEKNAINEDLNKTFAFRTEEYKEEPAVPSRVIDEATDFKGGCTDLPNPDPDFLPPMNRKTVVSASGTQTPLSPKDTTCTKTKELAKKRRASTPARHGHTEIPPLSISTSSPRTPATITTEPFGISKNCSTVKPQIFFEVNSPTTFVTNRVGRHQFQVLEDVDGAVYDTETQCWELPLSEHNRISRILSQHGVTVSRIPRDVVDTLLRLQRTKTDPPQLEGRVPPQLLSRLKEYQKEGVRFALSKGGKCLIGDEMGLGKTVQALAVAACYRDDWPLLIICPAAVRYSWQEETMKWLDVSGAEITVINSAKCAARTKICIVSYDLLSRIALKPFKTVILDESHYLKNAAARRTKEIVPLIAVAEHALLLTGTAALSRPRELLAQLSLINAIPGKTERVFLRRYCNGHMGKYGYDADGSSHLKELSVVLQSTVMIRRLKADVLGELPPKHRQYVALQCEESDALREVRSLRRQLSHLQSVNTDGEIINKQNKAVMMDLFRASAEAKLAAVCDYITGVCASENKFLVFAHHIAMLDAIEMTVNRLNIKHIRIDGKTAPERRKSLVDEFQSDDKCRVALLSITAAGTGITLSAAQDIIFAELYWTPGALLQCEDRAHRLGQRGSVTVRYLIARDTVDEIIWPMIKHKLKVLSLAMDGEKRDFSATKEQETQDCTDEQTTDGTKTIKNPAQGKEGYTCGDEITALKSTREIESIKWKFMDDLEEEEREDFFNNRDKVRDRIYQQDNNKPPMQTSTKVFKPTSKQEISSENFKSQQWNTQMARDTCQSNQNSKMSIDNEKASITSDPQNISQIDCTNFFEVPSVHQPVHEVAPKNACGALKEIGVPPMTKTHHTLSSQGTQRTISSFFKKLPRTPLPVSSTPQRPTVPLIEKLQAKTNDLHTREFHELRKYKAKDAESQQRVGATCKKRKRTIEDSDDIEDCSPTIDTFFKQQKSDADSIEDPAPSHATHLGLKNPHPRDHKQQSTVNLQNANKDEVILIDSDTEGAFEHGASSSVKTKPDSTIETIDDFDDEIPSFVL